MGKKQNKNDPTGGSVKPPTVNSVPNRDIMQRMNFLWQASIYLESLGCTQGQVSERDGGRVNGRDLAKVYVQTMKSVGKKTTTKMDPGVKRTLCKGCSNVLVPGVSARVRVRPSTQFGHWMVYTCLECSTARRIPAPRNTESTNEVDAGSTASISTTSTHEVRGETTTEVEGSSTTRTLEHEVPNNGKKRRMRKRKGGVVREPPLFTRRSAGHVVFRGGEVVDTEGVYCA
ncbi:Ribonuclease P protein subunit p21 [Leucoagaricus sp. SymC.cos]|nr:Ribonuclease P protein subunit p21 [Leucoagaricus sp. SymC.cos]